MQVTESGGSDKKLDRPLSPRVTRRAFLKSTALTAGALAAAGATGCNSVDTSGKSAVVSVDEQRFVNTCRGNCGNTCPLWATVREGKIVKVEPMIAPEGFREGQFGCVRGQTTPQRVYSTHRVLYPMKQTGERGSDNWEQISWDEAIALIAEKFQAAIDEYGGSSIALWHSFGNGDCFSMLYPSYPNGYNIPSLRGIAVEPFRQMTGATIFGPSSDMTGLYMQTTVLSIPTNNVADIANAKTVIVWGCNPTDAMRPVWPWICKARDNGAKIVTIDPVYTKCAAHSDIWLPIQGGTDAALMLAMCNYVIDNDLVDWDYMKNRSVAPLLVKEDGSYLRMSDLGMSPIEGPVDVATGESTQVDQEIVFDQVTNEFVASSLAQNPAIEGSFDANGVAVRTVFDLTKESIAPFNVAYAAKECGLSEEQVLEVAKLYAEGGPATIVNYWGFEHFTNSFHNYKNLMLLGCLTGNINREGGSVWQGTSAYGGMATLTNDYTVGATMVADPKGSWQITGEYLPEILSSGKWAGQDFPIRCIYVMNANPLSSGLGRTEVAEAFRQVDFTVVADSFMTDTAKNAALVLPVSMSWENEAPIANMLMQKAIEPAGESKPDIDIFRMIAEKMGYAGLYSKTNEEYIHAFLDTDANLEMGAGYDDLKTTGYIEDWVAPESLLGVEYNATGRSQFYAASLVPRDDYGQAVEMKDRLPFYEHAEEAYPGSPVLEKYPLYAMSLHDNYHGHSLFNGIPWLDELREPYVKMHSQAAAERGIADGDIVRVFNDRGAVVLKAVVTEGIRPDTVLVPHGFESDDYVEGHPQSLTGRFLDPMMSNNNYNDMLVDIEKYEGGAQ